MTTKKVLIVLTSHATLGTTGKETGFYLPEVTHPEAVFEKAGYTIEYVSPNGGKAPMTGVDLDDPLNTAFLNDARKTAQIENTLSPAQVDATQYAAIFYAGGHGTMWDFPENAELATVASQIYEQGGIVGAVCHGPAGLINVKLSNGEYLVKGKTVSAFTNDEEVAVGLDQVIPFFLQDKLVERGATYTKAEDFQKHVVVSDRLVTGQNPASAAGVGEEMVKLMQQSIPAAEVAV
jgi:putative intracellular protease/amidase